MPGQSVLTRTPNGARSLAAHWAKLMIAAFDALYGGSVCEPICPATDARNSIVPDFASTSTGAKAWATLAAADHVHPQHPRPVGRRQVPEREAELARADGHGEDDVIDPPERRLRLGGARLIAAKSVTSPTNASVRTPCVAASSAAVACTAASRSTSATRRPLGGERLGDGPAYALRRADDGGDAVA